MDTLYIYFISFFFNRPLRFQAVLNTKPRCTLIIGHVIDKIFNQCTRLHCTTDGTLNLTERTRIRKAINNSYILIQGQVVGGDGGQYVKSG